MKMKSMAIALSLAAIAAVVFAAAQAADKPPFEALDTNKDGQINASEARKNANVASRFADADKNQDGYLDREEYKSI